MKRRKLFHQVNAILFLIVERSGCTCKGEAVARPARCSQIVTRCLIFFGASAVENSPPDPLLRGISLTLEQRIKDMRFASGVMPVLELSLELR